MVEEENARKQKKANIDVFSLFVACAGLNRKLLSKQWLPMIRDYVSWNKFKKSLSRFFAIM